MSRLFFLEALHANRPNRSFRFRQRRLRNIVEILRRSVDGIRHDEFDRMRVGEGRACTAIASAEGRDAFPGERRRIERCQGNDTADQIQ